MRYYRAIDLFLAGSHNATSAAIFLTEKPIAKCKQGGNWSLIFLIAWRNRRGRLILVEPITSIGSKFFSMATSIIGVLHDNFSIKKWSETFPSPCPSKISTMTPNAPKSSLATLYVQCTMYYLHFSLQLALIDIYNPFTNWVNTKLETYIPEKLKYMAVGI